MTTLVPAYGRDYRSAKEVLADWKAGKDFETADIMAGYGLKTSIRDWAGKRVLIRYAKLTKVVEAKGDANG